MENKCSLLVFDSGEQILPRKSTVSVEQSDGRELLLHKLGYSPTQYSLYLVPNSALWAGLTLSNLTKLSSPSSHGAHKNIGTLLFDHGRHFSLVLTTKNGMERDNNVISEGEEYSTPKNQCDALLRDVGESGYSTNHSSLSIAAAQPTSDVIITSSPQSKPTTELECAKLNESYSTIIVSDSEDEEDPLSLKLKPPALPGLHTHRLQPPASINDNTSSIQPITSQYFLPPRPPQHLKHSSPVIISDSNSRSSQRPTSSRDDVIIISSSDEAELHGEQQSNRQQIDLLSGRSPQSSDEGIVLDSRWEGPRRSSGRAEEGNQNALTACSSSIDGSRRLLLSGASGEQQMLSQQEKAIELVKCGGYELTAADLRTLEPHMWLNDQIINSYMELLVATYSRRHKIHIMSTFFYTKLSRSGYPGVERWLRRLDWKRIKLLLVPVHVNMSHWALAAVNFRTKNITYWDSLGIRNTSCLKRLKMFMKRCARARQYPHLHRWRLHYAKGIPHQQNGSDCGVFVCQFARWLCSRPKSRSHSDIPFQQRDMPRLRRTMLEQLKNGTM